ncbi:MAG: hypothetical protein NTY38_12750 [Acidobacteria bacterium]|nr:hypothetical protein [Acidobacteriota bacterium]
MPTLSRRNFLECSAAAFVPSSQPAREYHVCLSATAIEGHPGILPTVRAAGVTRVWTCGFLYGHWYYTPERVARMLALIRKEGMEAHVVHVPLGHPGNSMGSTPGALPLIPPPHWKQAIPATGAPHWGTSLHPPATEENVDAVRKISALGVTQLFLDDDFRLARGPGTIGGCFCPSHLERFRRQHGYPATVADELRGDIQARRLTPKIRAWVNFTADELTACFRAQQAAAPSTHLGIMVMYLGAEKAGIRLTDYRGAPFRVGELMFDDRSFAPPKGKTDELFSALFHRRFTTPELAYSESTAFPETRLSAANMAAKLAVSTLADVRNTMFMSGLDPFPVTHWQTLGPAMKKQAAIHQKLAGHRPRGPFKHFWGEASRYVGDDRPYSLFLATGVPFEVTERPAGDGWTFLSDADSAAGLTGPTGFVSRSRTPETLPELFRLKAELRPQLGRVPLVREEKPVVCAWYPTARAVLLWNLSETAETFTLEFDGKTRRETIGPLDVALLKDVG